MERRKSFKIRCFVGTLSLITFQPYSHMLPGVERCFCIVRKLRIQVKVHARSSGCRKLRLRSDRSVELILDHVLLGVAAKVTLEASKLCSGSRDDVCDEPFHCDDGVVIKHSCRGIGSQCKRRFD